MGSQADFMGGAVELSISSNQNINPRRARVWVLDASSAGLDAVMPDATTLKTGGPIVYIANNGSTHSIDIVDSASTTIAAVAINEVATVLLYDNSTAAGGWFAEIDAFGSVPQPNAPVYGYFLGGLGSGAEDEAREYNYNTSAWTTGATNSTGQHRSGCGFVIGSSGYVAGSSITGNFDVTDEYDPDVWTARSDMGDNASDCQGGAAGGLGYRFCGSTTADCEDYTPGTDTWAAIATYTGAQRRQHGTCQEADDDLWMMYGRDTSTTLISGALNYQYDPTGDTWTQKNDAALPARGNIDSANVDDLIYCFCGRDDDGNRFDDVDRFDYTTDSWTGRQDYGFTVEIMGCAGPVNGDVYCAGGRDLLNVRRDDTNKYDPDLDSFAAETDIDVTIDSWHNQCLPITT